MAERDALIQAWQAEERQPFTGWDFSHLDGRMFEDQPPWDYARRSGEGMRRSNAVLDMGTGGGERLLELREFFPKKVVVTEAYPPNFRLAGERFAPLGIPVYPVQLARSAPMPFAGGEFDLVLNRHSAFNSAEVARILAPGGVFFSQQVDGRTTQDLQAVFNASPKWPDATLENSVGWLSAAGLRIVETQNWIGRVRFTDVGAIVYYLRAVPWLVSGFSVATHLPGLLALQERLERGEELSFENRKFLIEAVNP